MERITTLTPSMPLGHPGLSIRLGGAIVVARFEVGRILGARSPSPGSNLSQPAPPVDASPAAAGQPGDALLDGLRRRDPRSAAEFFDRYNGHIERVLTRILGLDPEVPDLVQEVFLQAIRNVDRVRGDAGVLRSWLTTIAVYTARHHIQRKTARRWVQPVAPEDMLEQVASTAGPDVIEALGRVRRLLERLPVDERIAFALRFLDDMELTEVASACEVSLATIKRRLVKARERFERLAARDPILSAWLTEGSG